VSYENPSMSIEMHKSPGGKPTIKGEGTEFEYGRREPQQVGSRAKYVDVNIQFGILS
jgi:hypothetical protein